MENIKLIAFDFGGTLDNPGVHWFDYFWQFFQNGFPGGQQVTKEQYWDAYVFAERKMESDGIPRHSGLTDTMLIKLTYQLEFIIGQGYAQLTAEDIQAISSAYASRIVAVVSENLNNAKEVLKTLSGSFRIYIVSNYYGNLEKILQDAGLRLYVEEVFDSTLVGIRKPNPAIWKLALDKSGCKPGEFLVVGDSMKNDIRPAYSLGCPAVLLAENAPADYRGEHVASLQDLIVKLGV